MPVRYILAAAQVQSGNETTRSTAESTTCHTGSRSLYFYAYSSTPNRSWLCLPEFEDSLYNLQLSFWAKKSSDSYSGEIKVGVMTDPHNINIFQLISTLSTPASSSEWGHLEVPMAGAPGAGRMTILVEASSTTYN